MDQLADLVSRVAHALQAEGIDPDGPEQLAPGRLPARLAERASPELARIWEGGAWRLLWHDDHQRLGRDARHGGIDFMTADEAAAEADEYAGILEDERDSAAPEEVELAERTWLTWMPFHRFPSGDCLAVDERGGVVVWQHDLLDGGAYYHGLRLGATLSDFLATWARVGFAEPRDWRAVTAPNGSALVLSGADWRLLL